MFFLCALCLALAAAVVVLGFKLYLVRKSTEEIRLGLTEKLADTSNTLITVSTGDKAMRRLAADLNVQLAELRRQRHRFLQGDAELKSAVTNISHDLRTPLTAISGYLELLEQEEKSPQVQRYLEIIANRAESMKALTEELFRYSVITSPAFSTPAEPVDIKAVLEESVLALYALLQEKGITPQISMTDRPIVRTLNRAALCRIFENLLQNAVKYSAGDLHIGLTAAGEIFFCNRAPALSEVQVERLFDRFYTVDSARHSTGLGLSIARTLTEQIGGSISAAYQDGSLQIKLTLPSAEV